MYFSSKNKKNKNNNHEVIIKELKKIFLLVPNITKMVIKNHRFN